MTALPMTWTVRAGWADVEVAGVRVTASYVSPAPEDFLGAVTRLLLGELQARVQFEAEPAVHRWHFDRSGDSVVIRLYEHPDDRRPGSEIWSTRQPLGTLARATVRCFDTLAHHGVDNYEREWRRPFPRFELEGLRTAWRTYEAAAS